MKILVLVDSPGTADMIRPVWPLLSRHSDCRLVAAHQSAAKILIQCQPTYCVDLITAQTIYENIKPDLIVTGVSSLSKEPNVINELTKRAVISGRPTIALQDYWGNHRSPHNRPMLAYWQKILVPDAWARDYLLIDNYQGKVVIVGQPGWERCLTVNLVQERSKFRAAAGLNSDNFTLLWPGSAAPNFEETDESSFRFLLETLTLIKPTPSLIARPHPRDEDLSRYERLAQEFNIILRQPPPALATDELLPIADVVIATYSTSLVHAALMQIPAVSLMLPEAGLKKMQTINLSDFPLNQIAAAIGVYENNVNFLAEVLIKLRDETAYRQALAIKQKVFIDSLPHHAAENITREILNFEK